MMEDEPERLLERVAAGERAALMALYDRFGASLTAVALRVTGSRAEAEEVVQDAMVRAWREAQTFDRARGSAAAWLLTLTRNRAIDVIRARRRRTGYEEHSAAESLDAPPSPEREVADAQRAEAVRRAMERLRPEQRSALELAYFSGLSHSEIAAQLQSPLGTVKTRIAQSVKLLREELARFAPSGEGGGDGAH